MFGVWACFVTNCAQDTHPLNHPKADRKPIIRFWMSTSSSRDTCPSRCRILSRSCWSEIPRSGWAWSRLYSTLGWRDTNQNTNEFILFLNKNEVLIIKLSKASLWDLEALAGLTARFLFLPPLCKQVIGTCFGDCWDSPINRLAAKTCRCLWHTALILFLPLGKVVIPGETNRCGSFSIS